MVVFNPSILENWKQTGYRYILILPRDKYGVLRPLVEDKPFKKGYTIEISEMGLLQMKEDYFLTKEKDAVRKGTVNGSNLVHFAAFKNHIGFYPAPSGINEFKKELAAYLGGKGSLRFPKDEPLPLALIKKVVKFRVAETLATSKVKK